MDRPKTADVKVEDVVFVFTALLGEFSKNEDLNMASPLKELSKVLENVGVEEEEELEPETLSRMGQTRTGVNGDGGGGGEGKLKKRRVSMIRNMSRDVFFNSFLFLDYNTLNTLMKTNKFFNSIINRDMFWRTHFKVKYGFGYSSDEKKIINRYYPYPYDPANFSSKEMYWFYRGAWLPIIKAQFARRPYEYRRIGLLSTEEEERKLRRDYAKKVMWNPPKFRTVDYPPTLERGKSIFTVPFEGMVNDDVFKSEAAKGEVKYVSFREKTKRFIEEADELTTTIRFGFENYIRDNPTKVIRFLLRPNESLVLLAIRNLSQEKIRVVLQQYVRMNRNRNPKDFYSVSDKETFNSEFLRKMFLLKTKHSANMSAQYRLFNCKQLSLMFKSVYDSGPNQIYDRSMVFYAYLRALENNRAFRERFNPTLLATENTVHPKRMVMSFIWDMLGTTRQDKRVRTDYTSTVLDNKDIVLLIIRNEIDFDQDRSDIFESISPRLKRDFDVLFEWVSVDGVRIRKLPKTVPAYKDILRAIAERCPWNMEYIITLKLPDEFLRELVIIAVDKQGTLLEIFGKFKNDKEVVLAAVQDDGMSLQYASPNLKNDYDVVMAAVKNNGMSLQHASPNLKDNYGIVLAAVENNWDVYKYIGEKWRGKDGFELLVGAIKNILKKAKRFLYNLVYIFEILGKFVNPEIIYDRGLRLRLIRLSPYTHFWFGLVYPIYNLYDIYKEDKAYTREFVLSVFKIKNISYFDEYGIISMLIPQFDKFVAMYGDDKEIMFEAFNTHERFRKFFSPRLRDDEDFMLKIFKTRSLYAGEELLLASDRLRDNYQFVLEVLKLDKRNLAFASPRVRRIIKATR
jgi:hypothetical protein